MSRDSGRSALTGDADGGHSVIPTQHDFPIGSACSAQNPVISGSTGSGNEPAWQRFKAAKQQASHKANSSDLNKELAALVSETVVNALRELLSETLAREHSTLVAKLAQLAPAAPPRGGVTATSPDLSALKVAPVKPTVQGNRKSARVSVNRRSVGNVLSPTDPKIASGLAMRSRTCDLSECGDSRSDEQRVPGDVQELKSSLADQLLKDMKLTKPGTLQRSKTSSLSANMSWFRQVSPAGGASSGRRSSTKRSSALQQSATGMSSSEHETTASLNSNSNESGFEGIQKQQESLDEASQTTKSTDVPLMSMSWTSTPNELPDMGQLESPSSSNCALSPKVSEIEEEGNSSNYSSGINNVGRRMSAMFERRTSIMTSNSELCTSPSGVSSLRTFRTNDLVRNVCEEAEQSSSSEEDSQHGDGVLSTSPSGISSVRKTSAWLTQYSPPLPLRALGILPWNDGRESGRHVASSLYQWTALLVTVAALASCVEQLASTRSGLDAEMWVGSLCYGDGCLRLGLLSDLALAVGSLAGFLTLAGISSAASECSFILFMYGQREGFSDQWAERARWDLQATLLVWALAVCERIRGSGAMSALGSGRLDHWGVLHLLSFAFLSGMLMGLVFCVAYVCRALTIMVDTFCIKIVDVEDLSDAVKDWNVLQAVLRKASNSIEYCFFVLQTTALSVVMLGAADAFGSRAVNVDLLIPAGLLTLGIARIFFCAAAVTEKCAHVPSLINSFGHDIDVERQYVVQYVIHSAAGFHVFEVLLTTSMALKFAYLCTVAAFSVATKLVSDL